MGVLDSFLGTLRGVFQTVILACAGAILAKLGPLDPIGDRKYALGIYYLFLPVYCMLQIAKTMSVDRLPAFGFLALSFFTASAISFGCTIIYCKIFKADYRCILSITLICTFGNTTTYPEILVRSLCDTGGLFDGDYYCQYAVGYAIIGLFFLNVSAWALGPFLISKDSAICYNEKRKFYIIRKLYKNPEEFMNDETFEKIGSVQQEKFPEEMRVVQTNNETDKNGKLTNEAIFNRKETKEMEVNVLEEKALIEYSLEIRLDSNSYDIFKTHFDELLAKLNPAVLDKICKEMPGPTDQITFSFKYLLEKLTTPPIILSLFGFFIGFIDPVRNWLFGSTADPIFMKTLGNIGNIAIPATVMLLGAKLILGVGFAKDVNLRFIDLVCISIIRLAIVPALGLLFMWILTSTHALSINDNRVLSFVMYSFWNLPPSVLIISVFLVFKYYSKEVAVVQIWTNILAIATLTVYLVVYIQIFSD